MPDIFFDSQESVPEGLREHATKDEASGKFKVDVSPSIKLKEFRDNNIAILKERDTLKDRSTALSAIVGEDTASFKAELERLRGVDQSVKDGKLKGNDAVAAEVASRVKSMEESYQTQLREAGSKLDAANQRGAEYEAKFKASVRDREITNAVLAKDSGANPETLPDILARASRVFTVTDDGKLIPKEGDAVVYGADGASPMTPREWLVRLLEEAPYFGKSSSGGGAPGNRGKGSEIAGMNSDEFAKLSPTERIKRFREANA